jgi:hypothetical protein
MKCLEFMAKQHSFRILSGFAILLVLTQMCQAAVRVGNIKADRILFLGNSITFSKANPDIGWMGNWGMVARSADKDYAHRVVSNIAKLNGGVEPVMKAVNVYFYGQYEQKYASFDVAANMAELLAFKPDVLVVELGENVESLTTKEQQAAFAKSFLNLLETFQRNSHPTIFVRNVWWPDAVKDVILKRATEKVGGVWVDLGNLRSDPKNIATSMNLFSHVGVADHPSEQCMEVIADKMWEAMKKHGRVEQASTPAANAAAPRRSAGTTVELWNRRWFFEGPLPAESKLSQKTPSADFPSPADAQKGFTVKCHVDLKKFDGETQILEIPHVLNVRLRQHNPSDRNRQNYPAFKMPDGSVPVLEATVMLHSVEHPDWKEMTIGIPLAMLAKPMGEHEVVLNFSGVRWTMYVDGELLDNDFPFGYPQWNAKNAWKLNGDMIQDAAIYFPTIEPQQQPGVPRVAGSGIQYWFPAQHNNWVGDVATIFYKGRYHVFYLYDRRHHCSKFFHGGHYFEHLSTADFTTWTEHEAATPLEAQWECIGTGTPFIFKDKLCLSYGLHTTRMYPKEKTTLPAQWEHLKKNGYAGAFPFDLKDTFPAGATYAISEDGVSHFKKSNVLFHPCENPSVFTDPSGRLRMMANYQANGIWESDSIDGGWHCISPGFPPGGDCTFFFRWGKFDYIIGGFTGLWVKPVDSPNTAYKDVVREGLDFYDGSNVPSVTQIAGGRYLAAAWIPIRGWAGALLIRELIQFPDGRIGSKWMKEIIPPTGESKTLATNVTETKTFPADSKSSLLTFDVQPTTAKKGRLSVSFLPDNGDANSCELQIDVNAKRAQFGPGSPNRFAAKEKSLRDGATPQHVGNYAIENLIGIDKPFRVCVIIKNNDKMGGSLVDAEIAGQRTMITFRADLAVKKLMFRTDGVEITNIQIAPLSEDATGR